MRLGDIMDVSYESQLGKVRSVLKGYKLETIRFKGIESLLVNDKIQIVPDGNNSFALYDYQEKYVDDGLSEIDLIDEGISLGRLNNKLRKELKLK